MGCNVKCAGLDWGSIDWLGLELVLDFCVVNDLQTGSANGLDPMETHGLNAATACKCKVPRRYRQGLTVADLRHRGSNPAATITGSRRRRVPGLRRSSRALKLTYRE